MVRSLVAPFAFLGAVGGWLTADAFGLGAHAGYDGAFHGALAGDETRIRLALVVATPIFSALAGRWASPRTSRETVWRLLAAVLAGGILNGAVVGLVTFFPVGAFFGAMYGGFVACAFVPFLLPAYVASRLSHARDGSLLAGVERRGIWGTVLVAAAVAVALVSRSRLAFAASPTAAPGELAILVGATVLSALLAIADGIDVRRARELAARAFAPRSSREAEQTIDLGVGDLRWEDEGGVTGAATYRDPERVARAYVGDPARFLRAVRVRLVASAVIALGTFGALFSFASYERPAAFPAFAVPASTEPAPAPAPPERVRVLYADEWRGNAALAGIDRTGEHAFVSLTAHDPPAYALDVINLAAGIRLAHWEAPEEIAYRRAHWVSLAPPAEPTPAMLDDERAQVVWFVRALAPSPTRWSGFDPVLALSPDGATFVWNEAPKDGHDGDFLFLGDVGGGRARRLGAGQRASYAPVFSPDGSRLAWHGCGTPCSTGYRLYVADVHGDLRGDRIDAVRYPKEPVWSADGRWVYAVTHPNGPHDDPRSCLWRVAGAPPHEATRLFCSTDLTDLTFSEDPTGATGLVAGILGEPPSVTSVLRWIDLPDGHVKRTTTMKGGARFFVLDRSGLALTGDAVVDLASDEQVALDDVRTSKRWISPYGAAWVGQGRAVALRSHPGGFELVAIDARGALLDAKAP